MLRHFSTGMSEDTVTMSSWSHCFSMFGARGLRVMSSGHQWRNVAVKYMLISQFNAFHDASVQPLRPAGNV